jgi:hypothetical protein
MTWSRKQIGLDDAATTSSKAQMDSVEKQMGRFLYDSARPGGRTGPGSDRRNMSTLFFPMNLYFKYAIIKERIPLCPGEESENG